MKLDAVRKDDLDRVLPIAVGTALVASGILLWRTKPSVLALPDPVPIGDESTPSRLVAAAHGARDRIARVMPENLATSIGRALAVTGLALILVRLLDEVTARGIARRG